MSYIEVKDVTTGYEGTPVSKHINFKVEKGVCAKSQIYRC